jgi:predicted negative regulator of RcsB-dependent stress response
MIDEFATDRDQEERLRNFWRENWRWMLAGIVIGVLALIGWRWYQSQKVQSQESAAEVYSQFQQALGSADLDKSSELVNRLASEHDNSPYASQARLALAKVHVEQGRFDEAAQALRTVVDDARDPQLATIASLRLSRVFADQGKHDEALAALKVEEGSRFAPLADEIRGDVFLAKGDAAKARDAYAAALSGESAAIDRPLVEMKLQQAGGDPAAVTPKSSS